MLVRVLVRLWTADKVDFHPFRDRDANGDLLLPRTVATGFNRKEQGEIFL